LYFYRRDNERGRQLRRPYGSLSLRALITSGK
jgi:hypothetical protein